MGVKPIHAAAAHADIRWHFGTRAVWQIDRELGVEVECGVMPTEVTGDIPNDFAKTRRGWCDRYAIFVSAGTSSDKHEGSEEGEYSGDVVTLLHVKPFEYFFRLQVH
jgi:hypothetical protein